MIEAHSGMMSDGAIDKIDLGLSMRRAWLRRSEMLSQPRMARSGNRESGRVRRVPAER
jgi:hypothetical protein